MPIDLDGDISEHEESVVAGPAANHPHGELDNIPGVAGEEQAPTAVWALCSFSLEDESEEFSQQEDDDSKAGETD